MSTGAQRVTDGYRSAFGQHSNANSTSRSRTSWSAAGRDQPQDELRGARHRNMFNGPGHVESGRARSRSCSLSSSRHSPGRRTGGCNVAPGISRGGVLIGAFPPLHRTGLVLRWGGAVSRARPVCPLREGACRVSGAAVSSRRCRAVRQEGEGGCRHEHQARFVTTALVRGRSGWVSRSARRCPHRSSDRSSEGISRG
jgi:hypothetical protein